MIQAEAHAFVAAPLDRHVATALGPERLHHGARHAHSIVCERLLEYRTLAGKIAAARSDEVALEKRIDAFGKPPARSIEALQEIRARGLPRHGLIGEAREK